MSTSPMLKTLAPGQPSGNGEDVAQERDVRVLDVIRVRELA